MGSHFFRNSGPLDIAFIAAKINASVTAPKNAKEPAEFIQIYNINSLENSVEGDLTFLNNTKYEDMLEFSQATACIMTPEMASKYMFDNLWCITHPNPYFAYAEALDLFYTPKVKHRNKRERTATIDPFAKVALNAYVGHYTTIEAGAEIGDGTYIGCNCYIGPGVKIGANTRIDSNVSISYSIIGNDVVILPGARIGQDGFGFATENGKHKKILHIGKVIIEDDVEIGANSTIDRGSINDTVIKKGARIDNLVQIGHNVEIGRGAILVAQAGIAGSSKIGNFAALGGQAGVAGHIEIADRVQIAGQSGVSKTITEAGGMYFGTPALPLREWQKQNIAIKKSVK